MRKYFVSLFVLFCFIFLGINDVKAADNCTCYYYGVLNNEVNGAAYRTHYLAQIDFNKDSYESASVAYDPNIIFFGEKGDELDNGEDGKVEDETSQVKWNTSIIVSSDLYRKVEPVFDSCSVDSCNNIRVKRNLGPIEVQDTKGLKFISFNNSKELSYEAVNIVGAVVVELQSISKEDFDELKSSDNVGDTSEGMGLSGIQGIVNWGNLISGTGYYNIDDVGKGCSTVAPIATYLSQIFWLICVVAIVFLVVMTAIDFIKAIVGSEEDKLLKAFKNFKTRIIVVIILILLPTIVSFAINIYNQNADNSNGVVEIGEDGKPFCNAIGEGNN